MDLTVFRGYIAKFNFFSPRCSSFQEEFPAEVVVSQPVKVKEKDKKPKSASVLAADITIDGSVFSETDVYIEGCINGNISCKGDVEIRGKAGGDIYGQNIVVALAEVTGNVKAENKLQVLDGVINGDVFALAAEVDGVINGNITVEDGLIIRKSAVITGDICAGSVTIEENAILEGKICVKRK